MSLKDDLDIAIKKVGRKWKAAKRHADKNDRVPYHRVYRMRYYSEPKESIRDVAFEVMESAYMKASSNGKYPANARQIYYAARPEILSRLGKDELNSQYFTQTLLKDYLEENRPDWDVVWDARGHISEPHTGEVIGLGGLEVRGYINTFTSKYIETTPLYHPEILIPTIGPIHRFSKVLFIEKEGFNPLLDAVNIPGRFDIAITSSKGMPVAALCDLLSKMEELKVTAYCLHDFDVSGFTILKTLKQGARGSHGSGKVIDLGFRIDDIQGLQSEPVTHRGDIVNRLREAGATEEEIKFLRNERVELNAMTSEEFVNWLETKLTKVGVKKYLPDEAVMGEAYKRAFYLMRLVEKEKELREEFKNSEIIIPDNLMKNVIEALSKNPENSWDKAIWNLVNSKSKRDSKKGGGADGI
jgi:DNA topoisomerase VI subunit A